MEDVYASSVTVVLLVTVWGSAWVRRRLLATLGPDSAPGCTRFSAGVCTATRPLGGQFPLVWNEPALPRMGREQQAEGHPQGGGDVGGTEQRV